MASEKPKQGDKLPNSSSTPQRNEELWAQDPTNSPADHSGIFDDVLPPFPFFQTGDMQGMPQHYAEDMPLPTIHMMNDFSHFNFSDHDDLYGSVPDIPLSEVNVNESIDYFPLCAKTKVASKMYDDLQISKIDRKVESARSDVARGSEMYREAAEANISDLHRSSLIGNQTSHGTSKPMATHYSTSEKGGINNAVKASAAYSTHPQILYGSSLKLGVGSNAELKSTSNVSSRYSTRKYNEASLPQSSALCSQRDDTSSLSSYSKTTAGFSTIRNNAGGFNNIAWNDSGASSLTQNVDGLSRAVQNAGGASQQVQNVVEFSNMLQNVGRFSNQMQSLGRVSPQTQNVDGFSSQLHNAEQLPRPSQNEGDRTSSLLADRQHYNSISNNWNSGLRVNANARFADVNPSTGFQGCLTEPLILHNRNQMGIPDYGYGGTVFRSSCFIRNATQSASDQRQNPHAGTFTNLSPEPSRVVPFGGVTRSNSEQIQSANLAQSQSTVPVPKSSSESASSTGQVPAVNAPAQASSVSFRQSRKRHANEFPLATPEALQRKVRVTRASNHLSTPNMAQVASPHAPPPVAWTPSLRPPSVQPVHPRIFQSPPNVAQINATHPAVVRIPHLSPPSVQLQTAHQNLHQSVPNVAQMTLPHSPLAWTPPNPVLVQPAYPRLAQFALNLARAPPPHVSLAGTPLSSPLLIQTVRPNLAQKCRIRTPLAQNTSVRPTLFQKAPHVPPFPLFQNAPHVPPFPSTKEPNHIKWQDPEKTPQLSGHQCFICKRDLSFTPEGRVERPVNPPSVAVLPCHHHFHAFCLERITTGSDPPCIPCALGDKN